MIRSLILTFLVCAVVLPVYAQSPEADLGVSKTGPDQAAADTDVVYTITVFNVGPDSAASVDLNDSIPTGMTFVSETHDPAFSCTNPGAGNNGSVDCTATSLAAGGTANFTFTFHIDSGTPAGTEFTNVAVVSTTSFDPNDENNSSVAVTTTPPPPTADLSITKNGPSNAGPNTDVSYTISVTNGGPDDASGVSLSDTLPGDMTFVSIQQTSGPTFNCTGGATTTCTIATLPALATATFTLVGHVPNGTISGTAYSNQATVTANNDPDPGNNFATTTLTVSAVDMQVTKTGPPTANAGSDIAYTITVTNAGPDTAIGASMSDTLPAGTTFVSLNQNSGPTAACSAPPVGFGGTVICSWSALASGASAVFTLTVNTANAGASITNTANAGSDGYDTNPANNMSNATTTVTQSADVQMVKAGPSSITAGTDVAYTLSVTNNGPSAATSVSFSDTLPANTTFVSLTGSGASCSTPAVGATGTVTCTAASLASGATLNYTLTVHVQPTATGTLSNTANVSSATADPNPGNNSSTANATVTPAATDVAIVKSAGAGPFFSGQNATFTITVTNNGPGLALNTTVTDNIPAGATFVSATPSQGSCTGTTTVTCNLGTLNPSSGATIALTMKLPDGTAPVANTATVTVSNGDSNPANDSSTATVTPLPNTGIPTLSEWALVGLALALAAIAVTRRA